MNVPNGTDPQQSYSNRMEYSLNVPTAGKRYIWIRFRAPSATDDQSDSVNISIDNGTLDVINCDPTIRGTWHWRKVPDQTLTAGSHKFVISDREDGTQVDQIAISSNSSFVPSP